MAPHASDAVVFFASTSALETSPRCSLLLVVIMPLLLSPIHHGGVVFCV
jgi:hypothetical protein